MANQLFGFEICDERGMWTTDGVGHQDASNLFESIEGAEAELANLAGVLGVDADRLRVTACVQAGAVRHG